MAEAKRSEVLDTGLRFCIEMQQANREEALTLLKKLSQELQEASAEVYFATLKNALSTTIRKRDEELFLQILEEQYERLSSYLAIEEQQETARDFIDFISFTVCDRRLHSVKDIARLLVENYTRRLPDAKLLGFWNEWTSLVARIARRQWAEETEWLLGILLHQLWRRSDVKIYQKILWQLQMHVAMYCRFDSLEGMLKMYGKLFESYVLVIGFAGKHYASAEKRFAWLQATLRGMSDMVVQLARIQMQEEQEVYQELYTRLVKPEEDCKPKTRRQWLHMLQICITYWGYTHPKSSRRQAEYLENILDPYYVNDEYRQMIEKMS